MQTFLFHVILKPTDFNQILMWTTKKKTTVKAKTPAVKVIKPKIEQLEANVWVNWLEYSKDALFYKVNELIDALNK